MELLIDEKYSITTDRYNFIVNERKVHKEGKNAGVEYTQEISYHPTLEKAFEKYVSLRINDSNCQTIAEVVELLKQIRDEIANSSDIINEKLV